MLKKTAPRKKAAKAVTAKSARKPARPSRAKKTIAAPEKNTVKIVNIAKNEPPRLSDSGKILVSLVEDAAEIRNRRIVWLVLFIALIIIVALFYFSLRNNIASIYHEISRQQVSRSLSDLISTSKNNAALSKTELEKIKNEVLKNIAANMSSSTWPLYRSDIIGASIKYPQDWSKEEKAGVLLLKSGSATATAAFDGSITITRLSGLRAAPADWFSAASSSDYAPDTSTASVGGWPAAKYAASSGTDDIDWIIYAQSRTAAYAITARAAAGRGLYGVLFDEILSTLKLN